MATRPLNEAAARDFARKLEDFSNTLTPEEKHFLAVILASARALGEDVQGYSEVDTTGLDIGETAAQVYYQYADVRDQESSSQNR